MCIGPLPLEISREIFTFLPLQTLIRAIGVNRTWRTEIQDPNLHINATRRTLLDLYVSVIETPAILNCLDDRPDKKAPPPLDREMFLSEMVSEYINVWTREGAQSRNKALPVPLAQQFRPLEVDTLPPQLVTYIREWPELAVFGDIWPSIIPTYSYRRFWKIVFAKVSVDTKGEEFKMAPILVLTQSPESGINSTHSVFLENVESGVVRIKRGSVADVQVWQGTGTEDYRTIWAVPQHADDRLDIMLARDFVEYLRLQAERLREATEEDFWHIGQHVKIDEEGTPDAPTFYETWTRKEGIEGWVIDSK